MKNHIASIMLAALVLCSCNGQKFSAEPLMLDPAAFVTEYEGKPVALYTLTNQNGMVVQVTNYGARTASIIVPDKDNNPVDVIVGHDNIQSYLNTSSVSSASIVGRVVNRIAYGKFTLDGKDYELPINSGVNHIHGGPNAMYKHVWDAVQLADNKVRMSYFSPDGEEGYPGNFNISVTFTLDDDNALVLEYEATTDAPTLCNPTFHPFFNLHGTTEKSSNSHIYWMDADYYTPVDENTNPTGEIAPVAGTIYDFRQAARVDSKTDAGYDLNFVLNTKGDSTKPCATLYEPETGILLTLYTDRPGLQYYSGGNMNGVEVGKRGGVFHKFSGVALETQFFPDAPHHDNFPSIVLRPGEKYTHFAKYQFSVK
ncbi:MAG: galactose mutarotase [Bacteroidales bacterium]|nr:galactose mutarotase [Bacteroidales bacterium]